MTTIQQWRHATLWIRGILWTHLIYLRFDQPLFSTKRHNTFIISCLDPDTWKRKCSLYLIQHLSLVSPIEHLAAHAMSRTYRIADQPRGGNENWIYWCTYKQNLVQMYIWCDGISWTKYIGEWHMFTLPESEKKRTLSLHRIVFNWLASD